MAAGIPTDDVSPTARSGAPGGELSELQQTPSAEDLQFASPMFNIHPSPHGIGGWLVLVAIGLVVSPFILVHAAWLDFHSLSYPSRVLIGVRIPGLPTLVGFEFFANTFLLSGWLLLIVLFFREHRLFPKTFQLWMAFSLVARAVEYALSLRLRTDSWDAAGNVVAGLHARLGMSALQALIGAVLWISYMELSERVKSTFVR